jgi:hypothetical protein
MCLADMNLHVQFEAFIGGVDLYIKLQTLTTCIIFDTRDGPIVVQRIMVRKHQMAHACLARFGNSAIPSRMSPALSGHADFAVVFVFGVLCVIK